MKSFFFLTAFAIGTSLGVTCYIIGGIALLTTAFTLSFVLVGSLLTMVSQLRKAIDHTALSNSGLAATA